MLHLRLYCPEESTSAVRAYLAAHDGVSSLAVLAGACVQPPGDVILADLTRDVANEVVDRLMELGVQHVGTVQMEPVPTWISQRGFDTERARHSGADAVVWSDVAQRAYDESELNWTYTSFMVLATLIAGIAIILDSQILTIGPNSGWRPARWWSASSWRSWRRPPRRSSGASSAGSPLPTSPGHARGRRSSTSPTSGPCWWP